MQALLQVRPRRPARRGGEPARTFLVMHFGPGGSSARRPAFQVERGVKACPAGCATPLPALWAPTQAEEARARFTAVATDLALAVSGLGAVREQAPPDVRDDLEAVQRQLEGLRFASRAAEERLTLRLMRALTLLYMRADGPGGTGQAGPLLAEALERAGAQGNGGGKERRAPLSPGHQRFVCSPRWAAGLGAPPVAPAPRSRPSPQALPRPTCLLQGWTRPAHLPGWMERWRGSKTPSRRHRTRRTGLWSFSTSRWVAVGSVCCGT